MTNTIHAAGENYLEAILELSSGGEVRSVDVAARLGVSRPSVNKAIGLLKQAGMVEQAHYGAIMLTKEGTARAQAVATRHKLLKGFLTAVLGVDDQVAEQDACQMEHVVSEQTMEKLTNYLQKLK